MCSKNKKTSFNQNWLDDEEFACIRESKNDKFSFFCSLCKRTVSLSNMGKQALSSHVKGKKHQQAVNSTKKSYGLGIFIKKTVSSLPTTAVNVVTSSSTPSHTNTSQTTNACSSTVAANAATPHSGLNTSVTIHSGTSAASSSNEQPVKRPNNMNAYLLKDNVTRAEILWSLSAVVTHNSMSSAGQSIDTLKLMFPDCEITTNMKLGRIKMGYGIVYGLAPYFHRLVTEEIKFSGRFVVFFDESLNKISQKQQMDLAIRFWSSSQEKVVTRYFSSAFLEHTRATDLLKAFKNQLSSLDFNNLIQVSMDGPNVNHKFLRDLKDELSENPENIKLLDIGSCGLHIVNNAFKTSVKATKWNLVEFLRAIYNVFKNVPARRGDYTYYSGSNRFPMKFCSVRWLENAKVAEAAIDILPNLIKFVEGIEKDKIKIQSGSYQILLEGIRDPMIGPKLAFFVSISSMLEPFLKEFQCDAPMTPFLYTELIIILTSLLSKFVKPEVINKYSTNLTKIDLIKLENLIEIKKVDVGYLTRAAIRKTKFSEKEMLLFRQNCRVMLQTLSAQLIAKSPLKHKLTKALSFCDPCVFLKDNHECFRRLKSTLEIFVESNLVGGNVADKIERDFKDICSKPVASDLMKLYVRKNERLDNFWKNLIAITNPAFTECFNFLKTIFILSHSNAFVERGFSINRECIVENQLAKTLISQRQVYDAVKSVGGLHAVDISKNMIHAFRNARALWGEDLEKQRRLTVKEGDEARAKKRAGELIKSLQEQKKKVLENAHQEIEMLDQQMHSIANP